MLAVIADGVTVDPPKSNAERAVANLIRAIERCQRWGITTELDALVLQVPESSPRGGRTAPRGGGPPVTATVYEVLEMDGGWLSLAGIGMMLPDFKPNSIATACRRMTEKGYLKMRKVERPNLSTNPSANDWTEVCEYQVAGFDREWEYT
jgi:hypothetical protein